MKLKVLGIGSALLLTLAVSLPLQSAPKQGSKPAKNAKPVKPSAQQQCRENIKFLALAIFYYGVDNDEHYPDLSTPATIKNQLKQYAENEPDFKNKTIFTCPLGHTYHGNKALSRKYWVDNTAETVLLYEPANAHDGKRTVAFADGHIESLTPAQWEQAKRKSGIK